MRAEQDYDAFGSLLPGRNYSSGSYRYLFQGQEHDDEINDGVGTSYAFEYRIHDPRIGRFLSIDPLAFVFPWNSPYAFSENRVLDMVELEGLEAAPTPDKAEDPKWGLPNGGEGWTEGSTQEMPDGSTFRSFKGPRPDSGGDAPSSSPSAGNSPSLFPNGKPLTPKPGGGGGFRGPTVSQGRPNFALNYAPPSSPFSNPWLRGANDINTGIGVGTGVGSGMFGLTSKPTPFRYAQNVNGVSRSAPVLSRAHTITSLRAAANLSRLNVITSVLGTGYTLGKINSDYQRGGLNNVSNWDLLDAGVGLGGLATSGAVYFGLMSNPVGWGIGIGIAAYYGARFIYEYSKEE